MGALLKSEQDSYSYCCAFVLAQAGVLPTVWRCAWGFFGVHWRRTFATPNLFHRGWPNLLISGDLWVFEWGVFGNHAPTCILFLIIWCPPYNNLILLNKSRRHLILEASAWKPWGWSRTHGFHAGPLEPFGTGTLLQVSPSLSWGDHSSLRLCPSECQGPSRACVFQMTLQSGACTASVSFTHGHGSKDHGRPGRPCATSAARRSTAVFMFENGSEFPWVSFRDHILWYWVAAGWWR